MKLIHMTGVAACAVLSVVLTPSANAVMTLDTPGIAGTVEAGNQNASEANVTAWANHLLSLGANDTDVFDADGNDTDEETYATGDSDFNGLLTGGLRVNGAKPDVGAFEWVMAKYDGQNAGYVLFHIPTWGSSSIPQYSNDLWLSNPEKQEGYELSNITGYGFRSIPDGGATVMMLGAALWGWALSGVL